MRIASQRKKATRISKRKLRMEQLRPYVLRVRDPMLKIVLYSWCELLPERVRRGLRSAAMARVAQDKERLVAAAQTPVDSFGVRLTAVERENWEAFVLRACAKWKPFSEYLVGQLGAVRAASVRTACEKLEAAGDPAASAYISAIAASNRPSAEEQRLHTLGAPETSLR